MENPQFALNRLLDDPVSAFIPMMRKDGPVSITVRAIEPSGIWIENRHISFGEGVTHAFMDCWGGVEEFKPLYDLPPTFLFIPWQQIAYIVMGDSRDIRLADVLPFSPKPPAD